MNNRLSPLARQLIQVGLLATVYYLTARLGFLLALPPGNVTILWPPSGLALAAMWVSGGWPVALGIFAGSLWVNWGALTGPAALPVAAAIATGSTLQAWVAARLSQRLLKTLPPATIPDTLRAIGTASLTTLIAPTIGVTSLCLSSFAAWSNYAVLVRTWWLGDLIGILSFTPSLVVLFLHRWRKVKIKEPLLWPLASFISGVSLFTFCIFDNIEQRQINTDLQRDAAEMTQVLQDTLVHHTVAPVVTLRALYASLPTVTRAEFSTFTTPILTEYSAITALAWAPRIPRADRVAYEQSVRAEDVSSFTIYEQDANGRAVPVADRADYYPVTYIEPLAANRAEVGFDHGSDVARRAAIVQAMTRGEATATAPVQLTQDRKLTTGILIIVPVYDDEAHSQTPAERQVNLRGLAVGEFHLDNLVQRALSTINRHDLELYLYDVGQPSDPQFLAFYPSMSGLQTPSLQNPIVPATAQSDGYYTNQFKVAGRDWLAVVHAGPAYTATTDPWMKWVVLVVGLTVAGGFLVYVSSRQKTEAALALSGAQFRALSDDALTGVIRVALSGQVTYANDSMANICGVDSPQALVGGNIRTYIAEVAQFEAMLQALQTTGQWRNQELELVTPAGERRQLLYSASLHHNEITGTAVDITERMQADRAIQQLSRIVGQMADTVVITDVNGVIEYVNPAFERLTGFARDEAQGQTPRILKSGQHPREFYQQMWATILRGEVFEGEIVNRKPNGELFYEAKTITPIRDDAGRIIQFVATGKDITERNKMEAALRQRDEEYRLIADNTADVIWILDLESQHFTYVSPSVEKLRGYTPDEVLTQPLSEVLSPESYERIVTQLPDRMAAFVPGAAPITYTDELRQLRRDGSAVATEVVTTFVTNEAGQLQVVGITRDITERKHAEGRIWRLNRLYATLSQINQTIVRTQAADTLFAEACRIAVEYGQFRMAWIGLLDERSGLIEPAGFYGEEQGYLTETSFNYQAAEAGSGPTGTAIREGRCATVQDIAHDEASGPWRKPALQRGYRSAAAVPFRRNGQVCGALTVYSADVQAFDRDEQDLLNEIGHDISFALDFMETQHQRQQAAILQEAVYGIAEAAQLTDSLQDLYPQIHQQIARVMPAQNLYIALYDEAADLLRFPYSIDVVVSFREPIRPGKGLTAHVLHTRKSLLYSSSGERPDIEVLGVMPQVWLGVPLMVKDKILGVLAVQDYQVASVYTEREQRILEFVSTQVATAIDRKQAEEAVRRIERRNRALIENAPDVIVLLDAGGHIIFGSSALKRVCGYDPAEVLGVDVAELTHPDDGYLVDELRRKFALAPTEVLTATYRLRHKAGDYRWIECSYTNLLDDPSVQALVLNFRDITDQKRARELLENSQASLETAQAIARLGSWDLDPKTGAGLSWSREMFYLFQRNPSLGVPPLSEFMELVYPADRQRLMDAQWRAIETGLPITIEYRVTLANSGLRYFKASMQAILNGQGQLSQMSGTVLDITEIKQAQFELEALNRDLEKRVEERTAEVRQSEATYRALFENSNDGIFLISPAGRNLIGNQQALNMLGYTLEEYLALPTNAVIIPEQQADADARFAAVLRGEYVPLYERTFIGKTGQQIDVEINLSPVRDQAGTVVMVQSVVRDITERKKAEAALRESRDKLSAANAALEKASRLKDEFLASMSHELRTPLTGILGLSESLQLQTYGTLNEKQLKSIKNIENSGRHLLELINDILDLSKIEAGKLDLQFQSCAVAEVCQGSLQLVKGMAHQKKHTISFSMTPAVISVRSDVRRLKQMLVNLLSNAIKFTPENGQLGLDVRLDEAGQVVEFSVWDKGLGIKPEELDKLFKPFVQLDSSLARQYSGTGLGLSLVQRMAELHGGGIKVESVFGEGSRFTISLPWSPTVSQSAPAPLRSDPASLKNALVIEDNALDADYARRYLNDLGIANIIQPTIHGALEKAAHLQPSAILLDLHMPDGNGLELLAQLKAHDQTRAIPVIIASVEERRSEAARLGALGYLVKPYSQQDLRAELAKAAAFTHPADPVLVIGAHTARPLVLMADDNEVILDLVSDFLQANGFQVIVTRSGFELLDRAPEYHPAVMLVDIQMPGLDGLETIRRLRAHHDPEIAATPIVAVTALAMPGDREKCLQAGANVYLSKPLDLLKLTNQIRAFLKPTDC